MAEESLLGVLSEPNTKASEGHLAPEAGGTDPLLDPAMKYVFWERSTSEPH